MMLRFSLLVLLALTFKSASALPCTCPGYAGDRYTGNDSPREWTGNYFIIHGDQDWYGNADKAYCVNAGLGGYGCDTGTDCCCHKSGQANVPNTVKCAEAPSAPSVTVTGDPKTRYGDNEIQFHLLEPNLTPVFEQAPFVVLWRAGNPLIDTGNSGDWVLEMEVRALNGVPFEPVNIAVVNPAELLKEEPRAVPIAASTLTTMRVSVGGEPLLAGVHTFPSLTLNAAAAPNLKPIGNGYAEVVDLRFASGLHLHVKTAAAVKFESLAMQVKALHLDIDFLSFNRTAARGPLPEIWGLRPISDETTKMLSAPTAGLA